MLYDAISKTPFIFYDWQFNLVMEVTTEHKMRVDLFNEKYEMLVLRLIEFRTENKFIFAWQGNHFWYIYIKSLKFIKEMYWRGFEFYSMSLFLLYSCLQIQLRGKEVRSKAFMTSQI